jgi:hypothetical protein
MESAFKIRHISPTDYNSIISVLDEWWGGRPMSTMLPKLFFTHFCDQYSGHLFERKRVKIDKKRSIR